MNEAKHSAAQKTSALAQRPLTPLCLLYSDNVRQIVSQRREKHFLAKM